MGWETRKNGKPYYYSARRVGRRVLKTYVGAGEIGRQAAEADASARREVARIAGKRREQQRHLDTIVAYFDESGRLLERVLTGQLLGAGWKRHKREWRTPTCRNRK